MFIGTKHNTSSYRCQYETVFDEKNTCAYDFVMSDLRKNLQDAMADKGLNAYDMEALSGVPQPTTQRFLSGKQNDPRSATVKKWAKALGKTEAELRGLVQTLTQAEMFVNVAPGPNVYGKVPLISWVQAGHASEVVDLLHPGEGFEWIDTTCQIKRHTYALRVRGDSMSPDFPDGSVIIVEPEFDPLPGDYVIAKNGDDEATFKQLIKDGADYYLKPLNERYPIKPLGHYHVIGVVRQLVRQFR